MSRLFSAALLLTLSLAACSGPSGSDPAQTSFFNNQKEFGAALPPGSVEVTPTQFMDAVKGGAKVITAQDLVAEKAAQQAQDAQDFTDARAYVALYPQFSAMLDPPAADAINADGDLLVTVPTAGGNKKVVLMGGAFARASLATHARTFPTQANQLNLYTQLYADLDVALHKLNNSLAQFGLPTPDTARSYDAARLLALNKSLTGLVTEYRSSLYNLAFLLDPANSETGSKDQLDRTQKGACEPPAAAGIYKNFDWPLKAITTTVKDQGQRGTCWAFATVAALEAEIARRDHQEVNLSEQAYIGHRFLDWAPRAFGEGGDPIGIAQKASAAGYVFAYEEAWQYNKSLSRVVNNVTQTYTHSCDGYADAACSNTNDQGRWFAAAVGGRTYLLRSLPDTGAGSGYRTQTPTDFWNQGDLDQSMVILLLRSVLGHATTLTLDMRYVAPDANGYAPLKTMGKLPSGKADFMLDHVMTVTGFISSQNLRLKLPAVPLADDFGYFIVKNSWGDCWGDQGYVYLPWTWVKTFTGQASTGILPQ